jgi:DNA-binding NarL/FixJ family response regulator
MQPDPEVRLALPEGEAGVLVLRDDPGVAVDLRGWPGGWGWLGTDCREEELLAALYAVAVGLAVLPPDAIQKSAAVGNGERLPVELTERELEVLDLLADGYANKQISLALEISEHTVKFHVSSIYTKLNVSNRAEAVRVGIQRGLVII